MQGRFAHTPAPRESMGSSPSKALKGFNLNLADILAEVPVTCRSQDRLVEAAKKMKEANVGALPVLDAQGRLAGVLTDRDIVTRYVASESQPSGPSTVESIMSRDPATIQSRESLERAFGLMVERGIRRLVVKDGEAVRGILSLGNLLGACGIARI